MNLENISKILQAKRKQDLASFSAEIHIPYNVLLEF